MSLYAELDRAKGELDAAHHDLRALKARIEGMARLISTQGERIKRLRKALSEHIGGPRVARVDRGEVAK